MPTTSNFGWTTPADTDYVKDGALAIRTLANGIDTSLVDLKGGTTGQILSKNSNTDLDYTWINNDQGDITNVAVTSPITGGGSSGSVTIGIDDGTTAQKGAVQLEDSTSSTSTTKAATPNSVKSAYDLANAAIPKSLVDAAGDIIYATADNTVARLAIGTAGKVLTVNSGATAPEWATPTSGLTLLSTTTLSGASTTITGISGSYKDLYVVIQNFKPATDGADLRLNVNEDTTSNRHFAITSLGSAGPVSFNSTYWLISEQADNTSSSGLGYLYFTDYTNTTTWKIANSFHITTNAATTTDFNQRWIYGVYNQTAAITSLKFYPSSGNFTSGTVLIYGVK